MELFVHIGPGGVRYWCEYAGYWYPTSLGVWTSPRTYNLLGCEPQTWFQGRPPGERISGEDLRILLEMVATPP